MRMEPMLVSYNENSALQATCQEVGNPKLAAMTSTYGNGNGKTPLEFVRVADFGCSGGRNSRLPMNTIMSILVGKFPALKVECLLEDLPSNPWHQVMEEVPKILEGFNGNIHLLCAGTPFYKQVCAQSSLDLGYSYVAAHFLSDSLPLTSHVLMHEAAVDELSAWETQAAKDWENFLLLRARELKKGGKLMISTMSRDSSGYSWKQLSDLVWNSIRKACSTGMLTTQEADILCIPACLRSEAEILAPFTQKSAVSDQFQVDSLEFARTEVPGERYLPADILAPLIRRRVESVWGGMFITQLKRYGRSDESSHMAMREVWDSFEEMISQDTNLGWLDMRCFYLQITKR